MSNKNKKTFSLSLFIFLRDGIYAVIAFFDRLIARGKPTIVVYCYHSISNDGWRFSVTPEEFRKQIKFLLKDQMPLRAEDLPAYMRGEKMLTKNAFVITFDDGYEDIFQVRDFLKENNIFPTIFVLSNTDSANREEMETDRAFLSTSQIKELKEGGWEVGSHSKTHPNLELISSADMWEEVGGSKRGLEERLGFPIEYFAYPKGVYTKDVLSAVKDAGYNLGFSVNDGFIESKTNGFLIPRVGVDGTHSMKQFPHLASPFAMVVRKILRKLL